MTSSRTLLYEFNMPLPHRGSSTTLQTLANKFHLFVVCLDNNIFIFHQRLISLRMLSQACAIKQIVINDDEAPEEVDAPIGD